MTMEILVSALFGAMLTALTMSAFSEMGFSAIVLGVLAFILYLVRAFAFTEH